MKRILSFLSVISLILLAGHAFASPGGLPERKIPASLGVNIHFISGQESQVALIEKAGFRFIRMDFMWGAIEKEKGKYDFTEYDGLLSDLDKHHIRALFILDYGNPLYGNGAPPTTDENRTGFANFAAAAAAHYKNRGVLWEIWNEPNGDGFWPPKANAQDYVKLAKVTYKALKQADKNCTVLAPALAGWDYEYLREAFANGLLEATDVVSLHAYGAANPEMAERYYTEARKLIAEYTRDGKKYPVVRGEWGYPAVGHITIDIQAQYLVRSMLVDLMTDMRVSIWYDWGDDGPSPTNPEHHFGTVYGDMKPKPAYLAMGVLTRELTGYTYDSRISLGNDTDYALKFKNGRRTRYALWTTDKDHDVAISIGKKKADVVSMLGEKTQIQTEDGKAKVTLSGSVQYIEP